MESQSKPDRNYSGLLAEPAPLCMLSTMLDPTQPELWFTGSQAEWADQVAQMRQQRMEHIASCMTLLVSHHQIDPSAVGEGLGWHLSRALVKHHANDFVDHELLNGLVEPHSGWVMFWALAFRHVPALRLEELHIQAGIWEKEWLGARKEDAPGRPRTLDYNDEVKLVIQWLRMQTETNSPGSCLSDRAAAQRLATHLGQKVSAEKIRKLLPQMRGAASAIRCGEASRFQRRITYQIVPFILRGGRVL